MATVDVSQAPSGSTNFEPIATGLQAQRANFQKVAPDSVKTVMQELDDVLDNFNKDAALQPGQTLPPFVLTNATGSKTSSKELLATGPIVLTFYRGVWCPYCNIALSGLQKRLPEFTSRGAHVVAISPQLPDSSLSTVEKNELQFSVLSDPDLTYSRSVGLVWKMPDSFRPVAKGFGIDFNKINGSDSFELAITATYLVDQSSKVLERWLDTDYRNRVEPSEALAWLDKHGL